jgi:ketosteroid isomerase-like protein
MPSMDQPPRGGSGDAGINVADTVAAEALHAAERRLQRAQLASDVQALDHLIDDRLVFTGPDGRHYSKQDDLHAHRSGQQSMTRVDEEDLTVLVVGGTGVTWFLGTVAGNMAGQPFLARVRYTRTWIHDDDKGWRLIAAHVSPAGEGTAAAG